MLCFLTQHTLIIYVQFISGINGLTSSIQAISFENDSKHYFSDSILKAINLTTHLQGLFQTSE